MTAPDPLADALRDLAADRTGIDGHLAPAGLWDVMARAAREHIAAEIEAAPATGALPYGIPRMDQAEAARIARGGAQ